MEMIQKKRNAKIYNDWNPIKAMTQAEASAMQKKKSSWDDDDYDPLDPDFGDYNEYLKVKKRERQAQKEEWFDSKLQQEATSQYGLRVGQLSGQQRRLLEQEIKDRSRKNMMRKAYFAQKQQVAQNRGMAAKDITLREVLEDRLKDALDDAERLEVMMNKTYDYHHRNMYERKLEQKRLQIRRIQDELRSLEIKKVSGIFPANIDL